jgi:6-phosphogluconolactonase
MLLESSWKQQIKDVDGRREIAILSDHNEAVRFAAKHFVTLGSEAIRERGYFHVALSGGSTPKAIFHLLAQPEFRNDIDWSKVILWWSDERCVEPTHVDSNYRMAMDSGFSDLPILDEHIHRLHGELEPQKAAELYEEEIRERLPEQRFDLIMLGMGPDGHTASLFPNTEGLKVTGQNVTANHVPQKETWRLSLTFECINNARAIVFYAMGSGKAEMLKDMLGSKADHYPAGHIGTKTSPALWIVDEAAANDLNT